LFQELKRRNVFRVGIAYVLFAWVFLQGADFVLDMIGAPAWVIQALFWLAALGLPGVLIFSWVFEMTPEGLKRESEIARDHSITAHTGRRLDRAIIGILAITLAWFAWDKFGNTPAGTQPALLTSEQSAQTVDPAPTTREADGKTVAVLPFTTRSTSEEDRFFSDGMHDDLLTQLAKIGSLKVISRTSVMEYRDTTKNLRQIGQELGAAAILEGAVQRAGSQVRINVQLIDAETDEHLWAETYDRALSVDNLLAMQTEMARSIATALHATLSPAEKAAIEQQLTDNLDALEAYRRAKAYSRFFFADELRRAESEIKHALELDSEFAMAWAQLAYINMAQFWGVNPKPEYRTAAWEAIERGRAIDPDLTELDIMEGYYHYWGFLNYQAALDVLEPLLPDNRNNAELLQVTAWVNRRAGNWDKTLELLHQAEALAPRDIGLFYSIGETYGVLRRWDRAQEYLDKTAALGPTHARTMQLKADIMAGRDGDFASAARFAGLAKQDQRFMASQHWEMLLRVGDYAGALEAAAFLDAHVEDFLGEDFGGLNEGLTHAYFGHDEAARPLLETAQANLLQAEAGDDPRRTAALVYALCEAHAALGLREEAMRHCLAARENVPDDAMVISPQTFAIAGLLAWAGAVDEAMAMLMPVAESGIGFSKHWYLTDKRLDGLRDHPDWPALMQALEPRS